MKTDQQTLLNFYEQMVFCFESLTESEKEELQQFEKKGPTSEWPGWKRHIETRSA